MSALMDRLKQIESFVAVAAKGSLTAAAQAEGVAPAVIGRRIDALEARLGVRLLLRTTRRITLTRLAAATWSGRPRLEAPAPDNDRRRRTVRIGRDHGSVALLVPSPEGPR